MSQNLSSAAVVIGALRVKGEQEEFSSKDFYVLVFRLVSTVCIPIGSIIKTVLTKLH